MKGPTVAGSSYLRPHVAHSHIVSVRWTFDFPAVEDSQESNAALEGWCPMVTAGFFG